MLICALRAVRSDRGDEARDVHRLRDVAVEAGREEPLAVALHRLRGQRDDGHGGRSLVRAQPPQRLDPVDVRQLDVHEHEVWAVSSRRGPGPAPPVVASIVS